MPLYLYMLVLLLHLDLHLQRILVAIIVGFFFLGGWRGVCCIVQLPGLLISSIDGISALCCQDNLLLQ